MRSLVICTARGFGPATECGTNATKNPGEPAMGGVLLTLSGTNDLGQLITLTTTDSSGNYETIREQL